MCSEHLKALRGVDTCEMRSATEKVEGSQKSVLRSVGTGDLFMVSSKASKSHSVHVKLVHTWNADHEEIKALEIISIHKLL